MPSGLDLDLSISSSHQCIYEKLKIFMGHEKAMKLNQVFHSWFLFVGEKKKILMKVWYYIIVYLVNFEKKKINNAW